MTATKGRTGGTPAAAPAVADLAYAEASDELDAIIEEFESGVVDVDRLVERLERATEIVDELDRRLRRTRMHVEELVPRLEAVGRPPTAEAPQVDDGAEGDPDGAEGADGDPDGHAGQVDVEVVEIEEIVVVTDGSTGEGGRARDEDMPGLF